MNNKIKIILFIFIFLIGFGILMYFSNSNNTKLSKQDNNYQTNRTSTDSKINDNSNQQENNSEQSNSLANNNSNNSEIANQPHEEQISTFSTKIYSTDPARQNNLNITCNRLNGTIVKNGTTFSFTGTLGPSNQSKGYQKADIFDKNGNKLKEYGGGNCQISSTLYNAVLAVPNLAIIERHAHSNYVPYIERGKDAAVAYGSYDLKFRNDSGNDIKILTSTDGNNVTATLVAIK